MKVKGKNYVTFTRRFVMRSFGLRLRQAQPRVYPEEVESLIRSYLKGVPLEAVIGHWMEANDYGMSSPIIACRLRVKADEIEG